jgi:hypothetical protein
MTARPATVVVLVALFPCFPCLIGCNRTDSNQKTPTSETKRALVREIADKYGIECDFPNAPFWIAFDQRPITGDPIERRNLNACLSVFVEEFEMYPVSLAAKSGLKRIVFCRDLAIAGEPKGGIAVAQTGTMYLEVPQDSVQERHHRWSIHHEFFHLIDRSESGFDARWCALNSPDFAYGSRLLVGGDSESFTVTGDVEGFVNLYATRSSREDRAELFAALVMRSADVQRVCGKDARMRAKTLLLKEHLAYLCPEMSEDFWSTIGRVKRTTSSVKGD